MSSRKLVIIILSSILMLFPGRIFCEAPVTIDHCKKILHGDDLEAKISLLDSIQKYGRTHLLKKAMTRDIQECLVESFIKDYDTLFSRGSSRSFDATIPLHSNRADKRVHNARNCIRKEARIVSQLYLPQHVNALILRDPQTITLQAYKRLAVEALTRHGEDLLANPRTRTDLMRMIGWAMQLSHRGEIEIKPEEKAQFHSLVEQTLEEMSKLDNPYDFIGILRPVLRAGRLLRLKDLDKHAVTILQHAYKHDPDIASRIMNLKFLVDWKIKGSEPLLRSSIELEKNPAVKRYFEELLTVYRKEKRAPDLPLEVKKVIIHAFLEKR